MGLRRTQVFTAAPSCSQPVQPLPAKQTISPAKQPRSSRRPGWTPLPEIFRSRWSAGIPSEAKAEPVGEETLTAKS